MLKDREEGRGQRVQDLIGDVKAGVYTFLSKGKLLKGHSVVI
jgi:hypothetical protein